MKRKLLSLLLLICLALGAFVGCGEGQTSTGSGNSGSGGQQIQEVDYAGNVTLDIAAATNTLEVTVKSYIDGDTTHFNVPTSIDENGYLKARYMAVNTPESTGTVEPWGKAASDFTKEKLKNASSIVIETDTAEWDYDSNDRALLWIWYKPQGASEYRNLNIELLQNGLAVGSKTTGVRYGETCGKAINQAKSLSLKVYSKEKDPGFFYGEALEITLKELRTNIDKYVGQRVAFEGLITLNDGNWNVCIEEYDEETEMSYGMSVFYGYNASLNSVLKAGNRVRMVGNLTYSENFGYQISSLKYEKTDPTNPDNTFVLSTGNKVPYSETTADTFLGNKVVSITTEDDEAVNKTFPYAQLAMNTSIKMNGLKVVSAYTTNNGGENDGAMTLTCETADGDEITVRTMVLKSGGQIVTQDQLLGKTIDVKGFVDHYEGEYQIKVYVFAFITIH